MDGNMQGPLKCGSMSLQFEVNTKKLSQLIHELSSYLSYSFACAPFAIYLN